MESKLKKITYELSDINVVQSPYSEVKHRGECDPYTTLCGREVYPIIVSPMGAVTDENNYKVWLDNKFTCVIPRTVDLETRLKLMTETFVSFSLDEAENLLFSSIDKYSGKFYYVCIDIAQGTMARLYEVCKQLKNLYEETIEIMTGNIATPDAYVYYMDAGIDYVRCFIGTGSRCTTGANVSIGYGRATLLDELRMIKENLEGRYEDKKLPKIVADGGISNFDDIQKCLALGADFVMCGNVFARAEEACGEIVYLHPDNPTMADAIPKSTYDTKVKSLEESIERHSENRLKYESLLSYELSSLASLKRRVPYREYMGMSTKAMQKATGGTGNTTAEGISRPIAVEYPIAKWAENMDAYLRSAMSYTGSFNLTEFRNNAEIIINYSGDKAFRK